MLFCLAFGDIGKSNIKNASSAQVTSTNKPIFNFWRVFPFVNQYFPSTYIMHTKQATSIKNFCYERLFFFFSKFVAGKVQDNIRSANIVTIIIFFVSSISANVLAEVANAASWKASTSYKMISF